MTAATYHRHMPYPGEGPMPSFMGFPPAPIFAAPGQYFTGRGREVSPFFMPNQYSPLDWTAVPQHYGPFEVKPHVPQPQEQEIAVNALLSLKSSSGTSTTSSSSTTIASNIMTRGVNGNYDEETTAPDLISALRNNSYEPGESLPAPGYDPQVTTACARYEEGQYPTDVKPGLSVLPPMSHMNSSSAEASPIASDMGANDGSANGRSRKLGKAGSNVCQICGKSYARPSTLKTHMRTHSGEKPYRCDACGKAFTQAANLTAHLRTHSGEKPFSCPICQKRFSQSSSVTTHLRTHSGERPYRCDYCGKCFSDTSTLTKHKRIHSGEKPYRCKVCNLGFSQSGNLHRHMKTHTSSS